MVTSIALLIVSNLWWWARVLRPIRRLSARTESLAKGDFAAVEQPVGGIEPIRQVQRSVVSMAGHVRRAQDEGYAYRTALMNGQEAERARIARELHDDTVQSLIAIAQSIDLASGWLEREPERAPAALKLAREQAVEAAENLRRLIGNLRPPELEELGLVTALRILAREFAGLGVDVRVAGIERRLNGSAELTLFRGAQEALRNAHRHSGAAHATVDVGYQPDAVYVTITDDGRGFAMPERLNTFAEAGHYGLVGISERTLALGGTLDVASTPGTGTRVTITLPLKAPEQPAETVRDPVCGVTIHPQQAYGHLVYNDQSYYFCCPVCEGAFQRNPEMYVALTHLER